MEVIEGEKRGTLVYLLQGYLFKKTKIANNKIYVQCCNKCCGALAIINGEEFNIRRNHNHPPDDTRVKKLRLRAVLRQNGLYKNRRVIQSAFNQSRQRKKELEEGVPELKHEEEISLVDYGAPEGAMECDDDLEDPLKSQDADGENVVIKQELAEESPFETVFCEGSEVKIKQELQEEDIFEGSEDSSEARTSSNTFGSPAPSTSASSNKITSTKVPSIIKKKKTIHTCRTALPCQICSIEFFFHADLQEHYRKQHPKIINAGDPLKRPECQASAGVNSTVDLALRTGFPSTSALPSHSGFPSTSTIPHQTGFPSTCTLPQQGSFPSTSTLTPQAGYPSTSTIPPQTCFSSSSTLPPQADFPSTSTLPTQASFPSTSTLPSQAGFPSTSTLPSQTNFSSASTLPHMVGMHSMVGLLPTMVLPLSASIPSTIVVSTSEVPTSIMGLSTIERLPSTIVLPRSEGPTSIMGLPEMERLPTTEGVPAMEELDNIESQPATESHPSATGRPPRKPQQSYGSGDDEMLHGVYVSLKSIPLGRRKAAKDKILELVQLISSQNVDPSAVKFEIHC